MSHRPPSRPSPCSASPTRAGARSTPALPATASVAGDTGRGLIADAHRRDTRVELVYTSFGRARNERFLGDAALQATLIGNLVAIARELGVDGINVDIEALDPLLVPAYAGFVANLRTALLAADPAMTVSVATGAHALGAAMAVAAAGAGADRIFLMGYDYRTGRSEPGASAPLDRSDGETASLRTSLELYRVLGVPADRLLLGLPLYGVDWPVAGPVIGAPSTGRGEAWFPRAHVDLLTDPGVVPVRDEVEQVDVYFLGSDGTVGAPSQVPAPSGSGSSPGTTSPPGAAASPERTWRAVYVDTPGTLSPKLALANEQGLAGAGFWAIGYTRGLPGVHGADGHVHAGRPAPVAARPAIAPPDEPNAIRPSRWTVEPCAAPPARAVTLRLGARVVRPPADAMRAHDAMARPRTVVRDSPRGLTGLLRGPIGSAR